MGARRSPLKEYKAPRNFSSVYDMVRFKSLCEDKSIEKFGIEEQFGINGKILRGCIRWWDWTVVKHKSHSLPSTFKVHDDVLKYNVHIMIKPNELKHLKKWLHSKYRMVWRQQVTSPLLHQQRMEFIKVHTIAKESWVRCKPEENSFH